MKTTSILLKMENTRPNLVMVALCVWYKCHSLKVFSWKIWYPPKISLGLFISKKNLQAKKYKEMHNVHEESSTNHVYECFPSVQTWTLSVILLISDFFFYTWFLQVWISYTGESYILRVTTSLHGFYGI